MSKAIHDLIQQTDIFHTPGLKGTLDILEKMNGAHDLLEERLGQAEAALRKVGLQRCSLCGEWFKLPDDGLYLPDGKCVSFEGLALHFKNHPEAFKPDWTRLILDTLFLRHRQTIETALAGASKPSDVSDLAFAMGWRLPIACSVPPFLDWWKVHQSRVSR